ncbi:MAG: DUF3793 family protein [Eubacteriales bacterium]|nr:DUF3793 family protein [Eubacteriales bacterium]
MEKKCCDMESYLINNCAPTLAAVKTANLFSMPCVSEEDLNAQLMVWNEKLRTRGVAIFILRRYRDRALLYVCRRSRLQKDLKKTGVSRFLKQYGYEELSADAAIARLTERMNAQEEFPHEIGVFLDYPLGDVIGFIKNAGKNYKCSGCWKVYCDECTAQKQFAAYRKCGEIYHRLWVNGRSIMKLTVAA